MQCEISGSFSCTLFSSELSYLPVLFNIPKKVTCSSVQIPKQWKNKIQLFCTYTLYQHWLQCHCSIETLRRASHIGAINRDTADPAGIGRMFQVFLKDLV